MKNLNKQQREQLKDEFLKELLNSVPREVLESLKEDIDEAIKVQEEKKLSYEEEMELIDRIEATVCTFIGEKSQDLSPNGVLFLMFKMILGMEEALLDLLGEKDFNDYKNTIKLSLDIMGEDNK